MNKLPLFLQIFRFGVVGLIAAIIHFAIVVFFVQQRAVLPLIANIFGFIIAFQVSYWGHRWWTFHMSDAMHRIAIPKLLLVQILCLAANESLFYIFLTFHLPYQVALFIVLAILPIFTFFANKLWVFI